MISTTTQSRVDEFLAKYSPAIEAQLRDARTRLHRLFPRGFELIFDTYNALVFGISATESTTGAFISIAGYSKWVTLFFLHGVDLSDPAGLLEGRGKQVRSIRLTSATDIETPEVRVLVAQAIRPFTAELLAAPALTTIIKSVVAKQRARRPQAKATTLRSVARE